MHNSAGCPHHVDAALNGTPLRCRTVSQTPTYDQLRGERINADVPAGEADPVSCRATPIGPANTNSAMGHTAPILRRTGPGSTTGKSYLQPRK